MKTGDESASEDVGVTRRLKVINGWRSNGQMNEIKEVNSVQDNDTDGMKVEDGMNHLKGVKVMAVSGKGETGDSNVIKIEKPGLESDRGADVSLVQEVIVKQSTEITPAAEREIAVNTTFETRAEAETKPGTDAEQLSTGLNADLERAAITRLAELEKLAERERQKKIKRREELDRVARLQRILALVRAPELDSVANVKQSERFEQVKEIGKQMADSRTIGLVTDIDPVTEPKIIELKEVIELKLLTEPKLGKEPKQMPKKDGNVEPEGIGRLERMSKMERILEIDRLTHLEMEADAKRKAEIERMAEVERVAELKRLAKMKQIREIDLKAELEKAEKERLVEEKRQEQIKRQEELKRVAKLQRVLVMMRASESDHAAEARAANLERIKETKIKDELKLLEELGIVPKGPVVQTRIETVKPMEGENRLVTDPRAADIDPVKEVTPVSALKNNDGDSVKVAKLTTEVNLLPEVKVTDREQLIEIEAGTEKSATLKLAAEMENKTKADREVREEQKEELKRVANLHRIIATVLNTEPDRVEELKQAVEIKRKEEATFLEELGIISKDQGTQVISVTEVKPIEDAKQIPKVVRPMTKAIQVAGIKVDADKESMTNLEKHVDLQNKTTSDLSTETGRDAKIKIAAEMESKANTDREARIKRREELCRVADLQRVAPMVHNEEFDHVSEMKQEELKRKEDMKRSEDMKVLEELGLVTKKRENEAGAEEKLANEEDNLSKIKRVEKAKDKINLDEATEVRLDTMSSNKKVETLGEYVIDMKQMSEHERMAEKRDVERRLAELRVAQMRRVAELGRDMKTGVKKEVELERRDSKRTPDSEHKKEPTEIRNAEEIESAITMKQQEESNELVHFELPEVKRIMVESVGMKPEKGMESLKTRLSEVKHEPGMNGVEMNRLKEMKRVVGMERVSGRDCEWDGQMMYLGKA